MIRARALLANVLLAALLGVACAPKSTPVSATRRAQRDAADAKARALQVETFDHAWQRIADTYPDPTFHGLDWAGVKAELRPKAERCRTAAELRPVLQEMLGRLGESHFQVLPGDGRPLPVIPVSDAAATSKPAHEEPGERADVGLDVRRIGDEMVAWRVDPDGPAGEAGIAPGWTIVSAGSQNAAELLRRAAAAPGATISTAQYVAWAVLAGEMRGQEGTSVTVVAAPPGGAARALSLTRRRPPGVPTRLGNVPDLVSDFETKRLPGDVRYVRFNLFLPPIADPFDAAMRDAVSEHARGVVIDVRGNPGGVGGLVMGMAGHLLREQGESLGTMTTREAKLEFVANPRAPSEIFDGPVALLVDGLSLSTSELFAAGLQSLGRARLFGTRTGGMALPSIIEGLPNGDRLQFALADLTAPGGRRIEGVGVVPDEEVPLREEDLLAGKDAPLQAALDWIATQPATMTPAPHDAAPPIASGDVDRPSPPTAPAGADLPDGRAILHAYVEACGGAHALDGVRNAIVTTTYSVAAQSMGGQIVIAFARPDLVRSSGSITGIGKIEQGWDGTTGWEINPLTGPRILGGDELDGLRRSEANVFNLEELESLYSDARTVGSTQKDGHPAWEVKLTTQDGKATTAWFDRDTGLMTAMKTTVTTPIGAVPATMSFADYTSYGRLKLPRTSTQSVLTMNVQTTIDSVEYDVPDEKLPSFAPPPEVEALRGP